MVFCENCFEMGLEWKKEEYYKDRLGNIKGDLTYDIFCNKECYIKALNK